MEERERNSLLKKRLPIFILIGIISVFSIAGFILRVPEALMMSAEKVFLDHEYYRILAAMFLHADVVHLAQNMLCLFGVSDLFLSFRKVPKYLLVYLLSGILGALLELLIRFLLKDGTYALGASGACMGVLGADIALLLKTKEGRSPAAWRSLLLRLGLLAAINLVPGSPGTDYLGHFSGFSFGFLLGLIL